MKYSVVSHIVEFVGECFRGVMSLGLAQSALQDYYC